MLLSILFTAVLLAPALVIAWFWRGARLRAAQHPEVVPDAEGLVLARVGGILCAVLPALQLLCGVVRWRTGEPGLYLWYAVVLVGIMFAVLALTGLLTHARGPERGVSVGMVLLSVSLLLLITFLQGSSGA